MIGAAVGVTAAAASAQPLVAPTSPDTRLGTILVLSGGGTRGAYEAGVIEGIVRSSGVRDGEPLPGVDAVVGTSIGAINGWFVSTAQYSALRNAWNTISKANIFRLKRRYAALARPNAFVLTRVMESLSLLANLNRSMDGVFDAEPIMAWLRNRIDPSLPTVVPLIFNASDIRNQREAYFYAVDPSAGEFVQLLMLQALDNISGLPALAEPAQGVLHNALYASIALPLMFDPIELVVDSVPGLFVDGGSSDNTAIDIARVAGRRLNVVLVDPPSTSFRPTNAVSAALGSFNLLQRRVLEASLRSAYTTTQVKRTLATARVNAAQRTFLNGLYDVDLGILSPKVELAADLGDFQDQVKLQRNYDQGLADAATGWSPYKPPAFLERVGIATAS
jgi:predicted acylesterase/phospholipase RssA